MRNRISGSGFLIIPEELIIEVLKELPVKSLLQFRCVCKRWLSIIDDPFFVSLHRERSHSRPGGVTFQIEISRWQDIRSMDYLPRLSYLYNPSAPQILSKLEEAEDGEIVMCAEGLALLFGGKIRNHSTRKTTRVSRPPAPRRISAETNYSWTCSFLGFDPLSKEYKLLYVGFLQRRSAAKKKYVAKICTLGRGSYTWRNVHVPPHLAFRYWIYPNLTYCCVNGAIYICKSFCVRHTQYSGYRDAGNCSIIAFEVGSEKFRQVPFPVEALEQLAGIKRFRRQCLLCDFGGNLLVHLPYTEFGWILEDEKSVRWKKEKMGRKYYPDLYNLKSVPELKQLWEQPNQTICYFRHVETLFSASPSLPKVCHNLIR